LNAKFTTSFRTKKDYKKHILRSLSGKNGKYCARLSITTFTLTMSFLIFMGDYYNMVLIKLYKFFVNYERSNLA
jgi:hypothetical protein